MSEGNILDDVWRTVSDTWAAYVPVAVVGVVLWWALRRFRQSPRHSRIVFAALMTFLGTPVKVPFLSHAPAIFPNWFGVLGLEYLDPLWNICSFAITGALMYLLALWIFPAVRESTAEA